MFRQLVTFDKGANNSRKIAILGLFGFFLIDGFVFIAWFATLPETKLALSLNDAQLGVVLLGFPIGSIVGMPLTGWLSTKWPAKNLCLASLVVICLSQYCSILAGSQGTMFMSLALMGFGGGSIGVAMNIAACQLEEAFDVKILSRCHGLFSIGTLMGALCSSLILGMGIFYKTQTVIFASTTLLLAILFFLLLPSIVNNSDSSGQLAVPSKALLPLSVLAFLALMSEGAVIDWSSVYLRESLNIDAGNAGFALTSFTLSMTIVRLLGDYLLKNVSAKSLIFLSGLITILGVSTIVSTPIYYASLMGFFLVGAGLAILMPVIVRLASIEYGDAGINVAAVSTVGYFGFLMGPPAIGFLSEATELRFALGLIGLAGLLILILSSILTPKKIS